jgi:hypothetical protein
MLSLKRTLPLGLLVAIHALMTAAPLGAAQPQNAKANWDNLKSLAPGDDIRIVLNDAKSYGAKFQSVSDEAIVVRVGTGEQTFTRETVLRVSAKGASHRRRNALLGLAAGTGTGVIVAVASPELGTGKCAQGSCVDAGFVSALGFVGAAIGAGVGAIVPTGGWHDVYRAR